VQLNELQTWQIKQFINGVINLEEVERIIVIITDETIITTETEQIETLENDEHEVN